MPAFSTKSAAHLATCDDRLQKVFHAVIQRRDCTVLCGHRSMEAQEEACRQGTSKVHWPNSQHNNNPSKAVDVMPYPIDWNDRERIAHFAGFVLGVAEGMGINVRWGGDWNRDGVTKDERFFDGAHFELVGL